MQIPFPEKLNPDSVLQGDTKLQRVIVRLSTTLERDHLVRQITRDLQRKLGVDWVLLYYFYRQWKGQVTFEALSDPEFFLFGSTGPDECFSEEYAALISPTSDGAVNIFDVNIVIAIVAYALLSYLVVSLVRFIFYHKL